jgi:diaminopimelate epimerase
VKKISFIKYQSCGNDFIIIDNTLQNISLDHNIIKILCDRHYGIGCDQLLIVSQIDQQQYNYHIFNNDGSESFQCANGARCVIDYIVNKYQLDSIKIKLITKNQKQYQGFINQKYKNKIVTLNLNNVLDYKPNINLQDGLTYDYVDVGNHHAVIYFKHLNILPNINELQKFVSSITKKYPNGININFYIKKNKDTIELITHERGVGFTLSCGSGACATVYSLAKGQQLNPITVCNKGGELLVSINANQEIEMMGPTTKVFDGYINL